MNQLIWHQTHFIIHVEIMIKINKNYISYDIPKAEKKKNVSTLLVPKWDARWPTKDLQRM